jgi:hypothetical protein
VVAALAGRPPAPKKTRHLAIPIGLCFLVAAFLLLGVYSRLTTAATARPREAAPQSRWLNLASRCRFQPDIKIVSKW